MLSKLFVLAILWSN